MGAGWCRSQIRALGTNSPERFGFRNLFAHSTFGASTSASKADCRTFSVALNRRKTLRSCSHTHHMHDRVGQTKTERA